MSKGYTGQIRRKSLSDVVRIPIPDGAGIPMAINTRDGPGDMPVIAGHRITVKHIADLVLDGPFSVEEVATEEYPQLSEQDVYDALEYVFTHPHVFSKAVREQEKEQRQIRDAAALGPGDIPADYRD